MRLVLKSPSLLIESVISDRHCSSEGEVLCENKTDIEFKLAEYLLDALTYSGDLHGSHTYM